jgi:hypothetical protein
LEDLGNDFVVDDEAEVLVGRHFVDGVKAGV